MYGLMFVSQISNDIIDPLFDVVKGFLTPRIEGPDEENLPIMNMLEESPFAVNSDKQVESLSEVEERLARKTEYESRQIFYANEARAFSIKYAKRQTIMLNCVLCFVSQIAVCAMVAKEILSDCTYINVIKQVPTTDVLYCRFICAVIMAL
jgi:hypothetical protein